jgi:hypothetical protein
VKTAIFSLLLLSIISCGSLQDYVGSFENGYYDFYQIKDKILNDDNVSSFYFEKPYRYYYRNKEFGKISINDRKREYLIDGKYPSIIEKRFSSKEAMFNEMRTNPSILTDYLEFFNRHKNFNNIRYYIQTISFFKLSEENRHYFSSKLLEKYRVTNEFLMKLNKEQIEFRFVDFTEKMGFMLLGDAVRICYSPDIDLSELSQEELLIFGFVRLQKTAFDRWYEISY